LPCPARGSVIRDAKAATAASLDANSKRLVDFMRRPSFSSTTKSDFEKLHLHLPEAQLAPPIGCDPEVLFMSFEDFTQDAV
jgi:hypothetical protein